MFNTSTVYHTDETKEIVRSLPRSMSASRILRTLLIAFKCTDKEWEKRLRSDSELLESKNWIRDHFVGKFMK